ncbi:MAG: portal protein, partial [Pseudomonadales bacterium]
ITADSISYVTSGLLDEGRKKVVSHLHKALKPINQLRMMEDAQVIYRISRAPERRIFYVDTGTMPTGKADEYIKDLMAKYRNKMTYDVNTGQLSNEARTMTMMEDFFLGRREGGRGTEISTLPGGQNLGEIEDIIYFQKRLYKSLNVPLSRLEQEAQFSLGRSSELTRDEQFFQKFVNSIRNRFGKMFIEVIGTQCILKSICTKEEWDEWKSDIFVEFLNDNYFTELKNAEIVGDRIERLDRVASYVGEYFSREWVMKEILMMSDDDITAMNKQMKAELGSGEVNINTDVEAEAPVEKEAPAEKEAGPEIDVTKTQNEMKRLV